MKTTTRALIAAAALAACATIAAAREPGVPSSVPAGNTMGVAIGANPPPGLYFSSRSGYWDAELKDGSGNDGGQTNKVFDTALQFMLVPGVTFLGGDFKTFVTIPLIHNDQSRGAPFPPSLHGSASEFSLANIEIAPVSLSWQIRPGIFVSAQLSIFAPTGKFDADNPINTGGDFWSFSPSVGYSYLRDGWNLSGQLAWFTNTESRSSDYESGDEVLLNVTAMKDMGGWSAGPVGYWRKQVSADENNGTAYGGAVEGKSEQLGLGLGLSTRLGKGDLNVNLTRDIRVRNTIGGNKLWVNYSIPLKW